MSVSSELRESSEMEPGENLIALQGKEIHDSLTSSDSSKFITPGDLALRDFIDNEWRDIAFGD